MDGENAVNLRRKIIEKGVKQLLNEAQVPLQVHLKIVKQLREAIDNHKKDQSNWKQVLEEHQKGNKTHAEMADLHVEQVNALGEQIQRLSEKDWTGPAGKDGEDGVTPEVDHEAIASLVLSRMPMPKDGTDGTNGKDGETPAMDKLVEAVIARVQKGDVLHINHVKGASGFIKDGIRYRFEELMHGSGRSSSTSSTYQVPTSGVVNGTNQVFVWATAPNVIVVDQGRPMQRVSSDGTVNWTGTTTTTLAIAPNYDIFATN